MAIMLNACQRNKLDETSLVHVYVENLIIEESYSSNLVLLNQKKTELFNKYKTTQKDFDNAMMDMKDDKDRWKKFFAEADSLVNDLNKSGALK